MIYFIQDESLHLIKIGYSGKDAASRLRDLQTGSPSVLTLLASMPGLMGDERRLHEWFAEYRTQGEWFRPGPRLIAFIATGPDVCVHVCPQRSAADVRGRTFCKIERLGDLQPGDLIKLLVPTVGGWCGIGRVVRVAGECVWTEKIEPWEPCWSGPMGEDFKFCAHEALYFRPAPPDAKGAA